MTKRNILIGAVVSVLTMQGCAEISKDAGRRPISGNMAEGGIFLSSATSKGRQDEGPEQARVAAADIGDAVTTGYGIFSGLAREANPILAPLGDALPFLAIPIKYGLKKVLIAGGMEAAKANRSVETGGAVGTCANIATLAGVAPPVAVPVGLACGIAYSKTSEEKLRRLGLIGAPPQAAPISMDLSLRE